MRFRFRRSQACCGNFHGHLDEFHWGFRNLGSENHPSGEVEVGQHSTTCANGKGDDRISDRKGYKSVKQKNGATIQQKAKGIGQKESQPLKYQVLVIGSGRAKRPDAIEEPCKRCGYKIRTNRSCNEAHFWSKNIDTCPVHEKTECSDNSKSKELIDDLGAGPRIEDTGASQGGVSVAGVRCSNVKWRGLQMF